MKRHVPLLLLAVLFGCDLGNDPAPVPASIVVVAGGDETATVGTAVSVAPAVKVSSRKGRPLEGTEVVFSLVAAAGRQ